MTFLLAQTDPFLTALASNGPWAVLAGFLLVKVINAWTKDRDQVTSLLSEFKPAIDALRGAVEALTHRLDGMDEPKSK